MSKDRAIDMFHVGKSVPRRRGRRGIRTSQSFVPFLIMPIGTYGNQQPFRQIRRNQYLFVRPKKMSDCHYWNWNKSFWRTIPWLPVIFSLSDSPWRWSIETLEKRRNEMIIESQSIRIEEEKEDNSIVRRFKSSEALSTELFQRPMECANWL